MESSIMNDVELMVASDIQTSRTYDYTRDRTPHYVQLKDVHNLIARINDSESLEATIRFQRRKEDEYSTRVIMPTTLRDITYDDEMNQILGMTSKLLAVVFEPEYKFAVDPTSAKSDSIEDEDLIFEHL
ncbi:hypothetical protein PC121_g21941 [Phytophthora cactorum]|nr:hypothetical protein PC121_g21941 [Phytophthora cactorum]